MFTPVYSLLPLFTCLSLFSQDYLRLLVFTYVHHCLLVFTYVYLCLLVFTCLQLITPFDLSLPLLTRA